MSTTNTTNTNVAASRVQADAPHPDSYRPDLPLRSELTLHSALAEAFERGHDKGYDDGYEDGKARGEEKVWGEVVKLEKDLAAERARTDLLAAQLAAKAS
jgi:hypothetical protein